MASQQVPQDQPDEAPHSGRLMVRMAPSLHAELAREAQREGISMNALITGVLAGAVGWRAPGREGDAAPRWARLTLTANLVLVGVLSAIAVALVIVALTRG